MDKDLAQYTKDSKIKETIKQNNPTNQTKTIGVVIPIYNVAPYLRECLDSVINQTYKNLSIVLVNDGSTDNNESLNIAKEYVSKDSRFILIDKENGGLSSARNVGIEWFKNKYQTKLDLIKYLSNITNTTNPIESKINKNNESNKFNEKFNLDSKKDFSSISKTKSDKGIEVIESNTLQTSFLADKTNEAIHTTESKRKDSINTMKTKSLNNPINQDSIHTESLNNNANTTNQNNKNTINDNSYNYGGGGGNY